MVRAWLMIVLSLPAVALGSVTAEDARLEQVAELPGMPDGPAWDSASGTLIFPDVKAGHLYRFNPRTRSVEILRENAGRISAVFIDRRGRLLASDNGNQRIIRYGRDKIAIISEHQSNDAKPKRGTNDLVADTRGGVYHTVTRTGEVFYTNPAGETKAVVTDIETPNGLILSPDGKTLYVAAYVPKQIWAYPVNKNGSVGKGKLFATMDEGPDRGADGMTTDEQGNVYCAGPAHIWVWNAAGALVEKIATPARPINCTFGDDDHRSLYITAGPAVYRIRMDVAGVH